MFNLSPQVCPTCGRCPTCGSYGWPSQPQITYTNVPNVGTGTLSTTPTQTTDNKKETE